MSARVVSAGGGGNIGPPQWRVAGESVPAERHLDKHARPPEPDPKDLKIQQLEQRVQEARNEAYSSGVAAGSQQAADQLKPVLATFGSLIQELSHVKRQFRHEAEASTVGLALAIARRVLYREIAADPEAILGLVKAAFDKCNARETHTLSVSSADFAVVQEFAPSLGFPPGMQIKSDPKLPRGSVIFETSRGDLDASIDTQLLEIERGFTDLIRRRSN